MFDITHFHKLIRSRTLWIFFLILIIASFVFSFSPNVDPSSILKDPNKTDSKVNGRAIGADEYQRNAFFSEKSRFEDRSEEGGDNRVLKRIALLDKAAESGILVSDKELKDMVGNAQIFRNQQGQFEQQAFYGYLIQEKWPSEATFFNFQRQEGLLLKLFELAAGGAGVVSPSDLKDAYERDYSRFEVEYTRLEKATTATNDVPVTDAMVEAYYNENKASYSRPEEAKVRYMTITVNDGFSTNTVSDAEAQTYYNERLATEFTRTIASTNNLTGATNVTANLETKVIPFEQARTNILMKMAFAKAQDSIKDTAYKIYDAMLPRRDHETESFESIVTSYRVPSVTSEYFTASQPLPGIDAGQQFNQLAFNLGTNEFDRLGEPLVTSNKVYIVQLLDRRPARIQELAEVKDMVRLAATQKAKADALMEKARAVRTQIAEAIKTGQDFTNAVKTVGLVATNAPSFSRAGGEIQQVPGLFQILNQADEASPGDLLEPILTFDAAIIARVKAISPADPAGFDEKKKNYMNGLAQRRYMAMIRGFRAEAAKAIKITPKEEKEDEKATPAKAG